MAEKSEEIRYLGRKSRKRVVNRSLEFSHSRWSELVVAGSCVDLLADRGIFTERKKDGRIVRENSFGVKIVEGFAT